MALTKVGPAGIGSTPGTGYVIGDSFLHSTGLDSTNAKFTGIVTAQTFRVLGNFQVDGTTTTLDTEVTSVDKLEVAANNTTVGVAITQSGSGDILNLYDSATEVFSVADGGTVTTSGDISVGGDLTLPDSIIHAGDTNTKIRFPAADTVTIETGGTEAFKVRTDQRVQITSGSAEIIGTEGASAQLRLTADEGDDGADYWRFESNHSTNKLQIATYITGAWVDKVTMTTGGSVGIGTYNPNAKLEVKGSGGSTGLTFRGTDSSGNTNFWVQDGGRVGVHYYPFVINQDYSDSAAPSSTYFYVHGSSPFIIKSDGNVGIGVTNPGDNLEIKTDAHGEGLTIKSTGSTSNAVTFDANRSGGGQSISNVYGRWNGTTVAQMGFVTGVDATNKNDGYIYFGTESDASNGNVNATERLRITSGGEVGINNTSPQSYGSDGRNLVIGNSDSNAASGITLVSGTGGYSTLYFADGTSGTALYSGTIVYDHSDNRMDFWTNGVRRLRIDSGGRVLQGLTSAKFGFFNDNNAPPVHQIQGDTYYNTAFSIFRDGAGGSGPNFILAKGRGAIVQNDDDLGTISFQGHDGTTELIEGAKIFAEVGGTPGSNDMPTDLVFNTNSGTSTSSERLRIGSNGQIGMGKAGAVTVNGNSPLTIQESDSNSETICLRATNSGGNGSQPGIVMKTAAGGHIGGIYCDVNSDYMRLSTSGTDRVIITDTGRVGINATEPNALLTIGPVSSPAFNRGAAAFKAVQDGNSLDACLYLEEASGAEGYTLSVASNGELNFHNSGASPATLKLGDDNLVTVQGFHATANITPTSGRGVEIFAASAGVGQISSYNRTGGSWDELRLKGSEVAIYTGTSNSLGLYLQSTASTLYGTSDGVFNLDTTDGRGAFIRFKQSASTKCWVGSAEGMGGGFSSPDQDDLGLRAVGGIRFSSNGGERIRIEENGSIRLTPEGSTSNPNARIDTSGDYLRLVTMKDGSGGCGFKIETQDAGVVGERFTVESNGKIRHSGGHANNSGNLSGSAYYRIVASKSIAASSNVTFVISGLASGWMTIRSGGYSNAGQSQYALMYQLGGYMTAANKYDVVTVQQWGSGVTISVQKNASDYRVTLTNNSGSYALSTNWCIEGSNSTIKIST